MTKKKSHIIMKIHKISSFEPVKVVKLMELKGIMINRLAMFLIDDFVGGESILLK